MRIFGFVLLTFVLGFVGVYIATVAGLLIHAEMNGIFDRDGGLSMGIVFIIGPIAGLIGGAVAALVTGLLMRRRARSVAKGLKQPPRRWPLGWRVATAGLAVGLGIYFVMQGIYWLLSPMTFESYEAAVVVANFPAVAAIAAAALAAWLVSRQGAPRT